MYLVFNSLIAIKRSKVEPEAVEDLPEIPTYAPDAETAKVVLDDADKLAAQGKFAEAVHVILFRSIQDIEKKRPHHVKRSLTSREIATLSILCTRAQEVFAQIAKLVENSFFGGRPLGVTDYETSKSAYQQLVSENIASPSAARNRRAKK